MLNCYTPNSGRRSRVERMQKDPRLPLEVEEYGEGWNSGSRRLGFSCSRFGHPPCLSSSRARALRVVAQVSHGI